MLAVTERRLHAEWQLLEELAATNQGRLTNLLRESGEFGMRLHGPAGMSIASQHQSRPLPVHDLRIVFPVHFPAVPMELYLATAVIHPNVHPETGFVCLWERHRVSNTVEHAMHKLVAMLAGELWNSDALHVMQPEAVPVPRSESMPLRGLVYDSVPATAVPAQRRKRLL